MSDTLDAAPSSAVVAESEVTSSTTSAQDDATADTTTTTTTPAPVKTEVKVQVKAEIKAEIKAEVEAEVEDDTRVSIVLWEATVTGRRLIDEMINLGSYTCSADTGAEEEFNEYVMPYGKLPLSVIRNYNLRIVDTGRYRMLKEIRNNKMLKSKSEVAACNDFAAWLQQQARRQPVDTKLVLVFFEPRHSKILQLFQALERYRLLDDVKKVLLGCVNGWELLRQQVHDLRDEHRMVLKALSDHHLSRDTPLETALQRAQAIYKILQKVHANGNGHISVATLKQHLITCDSMVDQVKNIKEELIKEAQWRPVFADMFRQGIKPRRRAGFLRHLLVESGITYSGLCDAYKDKKDEGVAELVKQEVKGKNEADVDELVKLLQQHMAQPERAVRRAGGRRAPRTRSLCVVGELDKLSVKAEAEENNNNNNEAVQVTSTVTHAQQQPPPLEAP